MIKFLKKLVTSISSIGKHPLSITILTVTGLTIAVIITYAIEHFSVDLGGFIDPSNVFDYLLKSLFVAYLIYHSIILSELRDKIFPKEDLSLLEKELLNNINSLKEKSHSIEKDLSDLKGELSTNISNLKEKLSHLMEKELLISLKIQDWSYRHIEEHKTLVGLLVDLLRLSHSIDIDQDDKGFSISDKKLPHKSLLPLESYQLFWYNLIKLKSNNEIFHCYAIHSCDINIWSDVRASDLTEQQSLIGQKGEIHRILCGEKLNRKYKDVAKKMAQMGINVWFCDIRSPDVEKLKHNLNYNFLWDFLTVKETKETVIWSGFNSSLNDLPKTAIYRADGSYDGQNDLVKLWEEVKKCSKKYSKKDNDFIELSPSEFRTL